MEKTFLVFDIETVEESDADGRVVGADGGEDSQGDATGSQPRPFPPIHRHRIIAIGAMWLSERYFFKRLGIFGEGKDEKAIVEDFNQFMSQKRPVLVTYNGRRFDVPVIFLRSLKHGLTMDWYLKTQEYSRRYPPTKHLDLCDILSSYGASSFSSLDAMACLIGLQGKKDMDGSNVQQEFLKGNLEKIQNYCLHDVVMTASLFLRYLLVSGEVAHSYYNECLDSFIDGIREDKRLGEFITVDQISRLRV